MKEFPFLSCHYECGLASAFSFCTDERLVWSWLTCWLRPCSVVSLLSLSSSHSLSLLPASSLADDRDTSNSPLISKHTCILYSVCLCHYIGEHCVHIASLLCDNICKTRLRLTFLLQVLSSLFECLQDSPAEPPADGMEITRVEKETNQLSLIL